MSKEIKDQSQIFMPINRIRGKRKDNYELFTRIKGYSMHQVAFKSHEPEIGSTTQTAAN